MDIMLEGSEGLQAIARGVFALLRSTLLLPTPADGKDYITALQHLWSGLPPAELQRAIYPTLSSYANPDTLVCPAVSLSSQCASFHSFW